MKRSPVSTIGKNEFACAQLTHEDILPNKQFSCPDRELGRVCVCVCPSEIFGMLVQLDPIYVKFERSKGYRSKLGLV